MILITILSLLISNAVALRRDMSILYNRLAILALTYCVLHNIMSMSICNKSIGLHGGLLHLTNITQVFHLFIFIITILILQLTSFYPRKFFIPKLSNPILSLSLAITIFSFAGIFPLLGFFAKQMVLSAALDSGYVFLSLVAILTSVIGGVYYLNIIKEIFFFSPDKFKCINIEEGWYYTDTIYDESSYHLIAKAYLYNSQNIFLRSIPLDKDNITIGSPIAITISIITLVILLFIFMNKEWLSMGTILVQVLFNS